MIYEVLKNDIFSAGQWLIMKVFMIKLYKRITSLQKSTPGVMQSTFYALF